MDKVEVPSKSVEETIDPKVECELKLKSEVECEVIEESLSLVKDCNEPDVTIANQVFTFDDDNQSEVLPSLESVHAVTDEMLVETWNRDSLAEGVVIKGYAAHADAVTGGIVAGQTQ